MSQHLSFLTSNLGIRAAFAPQILWADLKGTDKERIDEIFLIICLQRFDD